MCICLKSTVFNEAGKTTCLCRLPLTANNGNLCITTHWTNEMHSRCRPLNNMKKNYTSFTYIWYVFNIIHVAQLCWYPARLEILRGCDRGSTVLLDRMFTSIDLLMNRGCRHVVRYLNKTSIYQKLVYPNINKFASPNLICICQILHKNLINLSRLIICNKYKQNYK